MVVLVLIVQPMNRSRVHLASQQDKPTHATPRPADMALEQLERVVVCLLSPIASSVCPETSNGCVQPLLPSVSRSDGGSACPFETSYCCVSIPTRQRGAGWLCAEALGTPHRDKTKRPTYTSPHPSPSPPPSPQHAATSKIRCG